MKKTTATYIVESKRKLGNAGMSDRELGEHFNVSQQYISKAKSGNMSDSLAMKIAALINVDPGEVLLVARAEREVDLVVKEHLLRYAGKALRLVPSRVVSGVAVLAVALSAWLSPSPAVAAGGMEPLRSMGAV